MQMMARLSETSMLYATADKARSAMVVNSLHRDVDPRPQLQAATINHHQLGLHPSSE